MINYIGIIVNFSFADDVHIMLFTIYSKSINRILRINCLVVIDMCVDVLIKSLQNILCIQNYKFIMHIVNRVCYVKGAEEQCDQI